MFGQRHETHRLGEISHALDELLRIGNRRRPRGRAPEFAGSVQAGANDDWGGGSHVAEAMAAVGAFPFTGPGSRDAAALVNLTAGTDNSVRVSANGGGTGSVLAEIYDATSAAGFSASTPRLINIAVLKHLGPSLTVGFVVGGTGTKTVLIRAIGPTLGSFGVAGSLSDPKLELFAGANKINENDNWGGSASLSSAFSTVGAFPLVASTRDAVLLVTLAPGGYTAQVSGVGDTTGVALVEVYELP